jgi:hypothetical protein
VKLPGKSGLTGRLGGRFGRPGRREQAGQHEHGVVPRHTATTARLDAEALYSARNTVNYQQLWSDRRLTYQYLPTNDEHWQTALDAQQQLASTGCHRAVGSADLLIAPSPMPMT